MPNLFVVPNEILNRIFVTSSGTLFKMGQDQLLAVLPNLTSFVHLATLKIAKSLVISESGSLSAAVVLCDMLLSVSAANIKTVLSMFGNVTYVVLKSADI
ncbi:hypothetical protein G9A89_016794 [Geosiphon pyriformis]|nr:hypothetical protein G9A89_016794 [Geosiphon pyriformis]